MALTFEQAKQIARASAPVGGYTEAQLNEWANWAMSDPDIKYSSNPAQQMSNSIIASQQGANEQITVNPVAISTAAPGVPDENVKAYVDNLIAVGGTASDIKAAMDLYGVSPEQLARVYNADPAVIRETYNTVQASPVSNVTAFEQEYAAREAAKATVTPSGGVETINIQPREQITINPAALASLNAANNVTLNTGTASPTTLESGAMGPYLGAPSVTPEQIAASYTRFLNRTPGQEEIDFWTNYSRNNDPTQTANAFINEARKEIGDITRSAYESYLGRTPSQEEIDYWTNYTIENDALQTVDAWRAAADEELARRSTVSDATTTLEGSGIQGSLVSESTAGLPYGGGVYKRTPEEEARYLAELAKIPVRTTIPTPAIPTTTGISRAMAPYVAPGGPGEQAGYARIRELLASGEYTPEQIKEGQRNLGVTDQDIGVATGTIAQPIRMPTPTMPGTAVGAQPQSISEFIRSKAPTAPVTPATSVFSPENVSAQLELERLKAMNAPSTTDQGAAAGFAQGGMVSNDVNRLLQNQRQAIQRESQSRQMLSTLGAPPVKKFSDGGSAEPSVDAPANENPFAKLQREKVAAQDQLVKETNKRLESLLAGYLSKDPSVSEKDLLPFFPGYTEYDIAQMYGTTTEASNQALSEKIKPFTPEMVPKIEGRGKALQKDFDRLVRERRLLGPMSRGMTRELADGGEITTDEFIREVMTGTRPSDFPETSPVDTAVSDYIKFQSKALTDPKAYMQAMGENLDKYHGKPLREDPEKYLMEQLGPGVLGGTIKKAGGEFLPRIEGFSQSPESFASEFVVNRMFNDEPSELHKWIEAKLPKYIKNQLGTANDPLVKITDENVESAIKQLDAYDRRILKLHEEIKKREAELGPGSATASRARLDDEIEASENYLEDVMNRLDRGTGYSPERFEEDVLRANVKDPVFHDSPSLLAHQRRIAGFPEQGTARTYLGRRREDQLDDFLTEYKAEGLSKSFPDATESVGAGEARRYLDQIGQDTEKTLYGIGLKNPMSGSRSNLAVTVNHVMDELSNAMRQGTDLPPSLQIKPENLNQFDFERAARHVNKIDEWRMQQSRGADLEGGMKSASVYKEYPDSPKGLRWVQLKADESLPEKEAREQLQEALDREGSIMGHCVGSYCDPVMRGRKQIYSLRDKQGRSHVTIEVASMDNIHDKIQQFLSENPRDITSRLGFDATDYNFAQQSVFRFNGPEEAKLNFRRMGAAVENTPEFKQWSKSIPKEIRQIKGKGNDKQKDSYTPYVQDFVRTGNWSDKIGDFENTDLVRVRGKLYTEKEALDTLEPLIAEAKEFIKDPIFDFIRKAEAKQRKLDFGSDYDELEKIIRYDLTPEGYNLRDVEDRLADPQAYRDRGDESIIPVYETVLKIVDKIKDNLPATREAAERLGSEVDKYAHGGEITSFIKRAAGGVAADDSWKDEMIRQANAQYGRTSPDDLIFRERQLSREMGKPIKGVKIPPAIKAVFPDYKLVEDISGRADSKDNARVEWIRPNVVLGDPDFIRNNPLVLPHEFEHQMAGRGRQRYAPKDVYRSSEAVKDLIDQANSIKDEKKRKRRLAEISSSLETLEKGPEYFMQKSIEQRGSTPDEAKGYLNYFKRALGNPEVAEYLLKKFPDLMNQKKGSAIMPFERIGREGHLLEEYLADLSGIETYKNVDLTKDKFLRRNLFLNDDDLIAQYKAVTGYRQERFDAKDLPPYTPDYIVQDTKAVK